MRWVGGVDSQYNQIHKLENNCIVEILPREWVMSQSQIPQPGVPVDGRQAQQSMWLWRPRGLNCRSLTGVRKTRVHSNSALKTSCTLEPKGNISNLLGAWARPNLVLERLLVWATQRLASDGLQKHSSCHIGSSLPRPGPTQKPMGASAGMPQAKQLTGQEHGLTHQQTGCLKSSPAASEQSWAWQPTRLGTN